MHISFTKKTFYVVKYKLSRKTCATISGYEKELHILKVLYVIYIYVSINKYHV